LQQNIDRWHVLLTQTQWRRQLWGTGARAPLLDFQHFHF